MKVGYATGDWVEGATLEDGSQILGGSGWVRVQQYIPYSAHDFVTGSLAWHPEEEIFGVQDWWGNEHWDFDVLLFQRWMHSTIPERTRIAQSNGQIIVNDIDDWYWGLSSDNRAFASSHPKKNPDENVNHYKKSLARSNAVITSTPYLAERLSAFVKPDKLYLQMNHIDIDRFQRYEHTESKKPVIGWVGSTGHRHGDLAVLKTVYRNLGALDWGYHHSGHVGWYPHFYEEVGLGIDDVTILLPVPGPNLAQLMRFDIGVVPLTMNPFNDSKSWIKGLEYAAAGIPFIASPSAAYKQLKEEYGVGLLAKRQMDWIKHLTVLRDPKARQDIADENWERIQPLHAKYGAAKLDSTLNEIVKNHAV